MMQSNNIYEWDYEVVGWSQKPMSEEEWRKEVLSRLDRIAFLLEQMQPPRINVRLPDFSFSSKGD